MAETFKTNNIIGTSQTRIEGARKVTGDVQYGADQPIENVAYAYIAMSAIALGEIKNIDESKARAMKGVLQILTYKNAGENVVKHGKPIMKLGYMANSIPPLDRQIHFAGQVVAMAIAESFEIARDAAESLQIDYNVKPPTASLNSKGIGEVKPKAMGETKLEHGDFQKAYNAAPVKIDVEYETPAQHHNPLELFQSTCAWGGDKLTIWESVQNSRGLQRGVAKQLGIDHDDVRVFSKYVGGAFGSRGEAATTTALVAYAARELKRPVKLVVSRQQGFTLRTFRAETKHHIKLAADNSGKLQALSHESWELTSRSENFALAGSASTARLYACDNIRTHVHNTTADRQTPGFMRAPPEVPYLFAHESAMDELAYKLKMDPIEFRRINDTKVEPIKKLPYTSRALMQCFDTAAKEFGWSERNPEPRSMQDDDWLIGHGCATASYPVQIGPAHARVTLFAGGTAKVETGTHDIGTGMYTIIAQTVADQLKLAIEKIDVIIGDSSLPSTPLTAGSSGSASVCNVVAKACIEVMEKLSKLDSPQNEPIIVEASNNPHGAPPLVGPLLINKALPILVGGVMKDRMQFSFGAHFVEVKVHKATGEIRVPRVVSAFAAGRILNPLTAKSQLMGGQIWGIGAALLEATKIDERHARYVNADLAEYHVAVNADVGKITTLMLPETDDEINQLGIKGIGELGVTGMNAAIANAVFHATGVRIRKLPIQLDKMVV